MRVNRAATVVLLLAASVWAQSAPGVSPSARRLGRRGVPVQTVAADADTKSQVPSVMHARMQTMGETLQKMHAVLKQMRAKAAPTDQTAKMNVEMWDLLLGDLDKQ